MGTQGQFGDTGLGWVHEDSLEIWVPSRLGDMGQAQGHRTGLGTRGQSGDTGVPPGSETQGWFGDRWLSREYWAGLGTWSLSRLRVWYGDTGTVWGHWEQFWDPETVWGHGAGLGTRGWSRLGVWGWCGDTGSVWGHQVCPRSLGVGTRGQFGNWGWLPVADLGTRGRFGDTESVLVWGLEVSLGTQLRSRLGDTGLVPVWGHWDYLGTRFHSQFVGRGCGLGPGAGTRGWFGDIRSLPHWGHRAGPGVGTRG